MEKVESGNRPGPRKPVIISKEEFCKMRISEVLKVIDDNGALFIAIKGELPLKVTRSSLQ